MPKISLLFVAAIFFSSLSFSAQRNGNIVASPGKNVFVMENITIPIVKDRRIFGYLRLTAHLQAKDEHELEKLKKMKPLLQNAYFSDLYGAMSDLWIGDKDPKPESIQKRLTRVTDKVLGAGEVSLFIKKLFLQRME